MIQYELNEIYAHQNPKVILIDIGCMSSYSHAYNDDNFDGRFRAFINNIPLSTNKIQAIDNLSKQQEKTSYYLPFITYHGFIPNTETIEKIEIHITNSVSIFLFLACKTQKYIIAVKTSIAINCQISKYSL